VIGDWALSPIPNPQSPITNPHLNPKNICKSFKISIKEKYLNMKINIEMIY